MKGEGVYIYNIYILPLHSLSDSGKLCLNVKLFRQSFPQFAKELLALMY